MHQVLKAAIFSLVGPLLAASSDAVLISDLVVNYSDFSYISSVAVGYDYVYWGTTHGVIRYNITNSKWDTPLTGIEGFADEPILDLEASFDDENVWVKTDLGIFEYSETMKRWTPVDAMPETPSRGRHLTPDQGFFAPWGYNYMSNGVLVDEMGRRFPITDVLDDGWTNFWIATWGLGAARSDNTNLRIELLSFGLLQKDITTIHSDNGLLWMGGKTMDSYRSGITIFDWNNNSFAYVETSPGLIQKAFDINDIYSNDRDIFVASDNGIMVIDKKEKRVREKLYRKSGLPDDRVLSVYARGDTLFAGTEYGLGIINVYSDSARQAVETYLPSSAILCLEMVGDALWIGTDRGAYRLNLPSKQLSRLTAPEITQAGAIYDIKGTQNTVWLATQTELASIDLNTAEIKVYPEVNAYGGVKAIAVWDTLLAAAVGNGLMLFYLGEEPYSRIITKSDGLISDNIRDLVIDDEYIWVGTDEGLTRFWYKNPYF
jgi:ligand-binding sensor domain-containing protein